MKHGWLSSPGSVFYRTNYGVYSVYCQSSPHGRGAGLGDPVLHFDGSNGHLLGERVPGEGTAGDVFFQLQFPLHSGQIAGLPGRILICVTGLVVHCFRSLESLLGCISGKMRRGLLWKS